MQTPSTSSTPCPVNWDEGIKRVAGNKALFEKLLHRIADGLPNDLATIEQNIAAGDMEALSHIAHTLKGSAGNLSIVAVYEQSMVLEAAAKAGDIAQATDALQRLQASSAEFITYLKAL